MYPSRTMIPTSLAILLWTPTSVNICVMGDVPEQHDDDADVVGQHSLDDNERRHLSCTRAAS